MENKVEYYPLTHPQKGIWYTEKMYPGTSIGVIAATLKIKERLELPLLQKAINILIQNHDAFRLHFKEIDGEPVQYISEYEYKEIDFFDFSKEGLESLYSWDSQKSQTPFELIDSDLYYFAILKISDEEFGIYSKLHHLISDGWSVVQAGNEVIKMYTEIINDNYSVNIKTSSYSTYIKSENDYLESSRFQNDKAFWNSRLYDLNFISPFRKRTNKLSTRAKRKTYIVPGKLAKKIKDYAGTNGTTAFTLFLSALSIYLSRVTGEDSQVVGIPVLNRLNAIEKDTVGMFINTVPFNVMLNEDIDFRTFVTHITKDWLTILRHQKYPIDLIKKDLQKTRNEDLFNILLSYQNAKFSNNRNLVRHEGRWHFNGRQLEPLCIHVNEREDDGQLIIDYDYLVDMFYSKEIDFLHEHILRILWHGLDNPNKQVSKLDIVSEKEKSKILFEFNQTQADYPREMTIHQIFEDVAEKYSSKTAVVCENSSITYSELNSRANCLAKLLRDKGVEANTIVGILLDRSIDMIIAILGILKAGGIYLPLDPSYPQNRIASYITGSKPLLILTSKTILDSYSQMLDSMQIDADRLILVNSLLFLKKNSINLNNINKPNDIAYIIYTSGSTGNPKGVMVQHKNVVRLMKNSRMPFDFSSDDVWTMFHSYCFDFSVWEMYGALLYGGKLVIVPRPIAQDPVEFHKLLIRNKVTVLNQIPTSFYNLSSVESKMKESLLGLRYVIFGGEALKPANLKTWKTRYQKTRLINMFGITETTVHATFKEVNFDLIGTNACNIGVPLPTLDIYILDKYKQIVPIGVKGEIYVGGDGVAQGYLNRPELTEERFIDNPYKEGERLYKSGDAGRWYANGEIEYLGRLDYQVKIHGFRVEIGEVESKITSYSKVKDAVVIPIQNEYGDNTLSAYIVSDEIIDISDLRIYLNSILPKYMVPGNYVLLNKMPLTSSGKIDKKALLQIKQEQSTCEYHQPRNMDESRLVEIWQDVLGLDRIGIRDNFFELGGDSLSIIRCQIKMFSYNWGIKTQDFYKYPTIEQLYDNVIGKQDDINRLGSEVYNYDLKKILKPNDSKPFKNILVTGVTGFLGMHLLHTLLMETDATIFCIARAKNDVDPLTRVISEYEFYFDELKPEYVKRIKVYGGDISEVNLGLKEREYKLLSGMTDTVFHVAANVKHYGVYTEFAKTNICGTEEVIKFCLKADAVLHHISTISISGNTTIGGKSDVVTFTEDDYFIGQNVFDNVYLKTKFEAEKLVFEAVKKGLRANIYRLGNLSARYSDGKFQENIWENAFYRRIKSIMLIGAVSERLENMLIEITPIDYCSDAIVKIAKHGKVNAVYHLYNNKFKVKKLIRIIRKLGIADIVTMDELQFRNHIISLSNDLNKQNSIAGLINELNNLEGFDYEESIVVSNEKTNEILNSIGFSWPDTTVMGYVSKMFSYMKEVEFINNNDDESTCVV